MVKSSRWLEINTNTSHIFAGKKSDVTGLTEFMGPGHGVFTSTSNAPPIPPYKAEPMLRSTSVGNYMSSPWLMVLGPLQNNP